MSQNGLLFKNTFFEYKLRNNNGQSIIIFYSRNLMNRFKINIKTLKHKT